MVFSFLLKLPDHLQPAAICLHLSQELKSPGLLNLPQGSFHSKQCHNPLAWSPPCPGVIRRAHHVQAQVIASQTTSTPIRMGAFQTACDTLCPTTFSHPRVPCLIFLSGLWLYSAANPELLKFWHIITRPLMAASLWQVREAYTLKVRLESSWATESSIPAQGSQTFPCF